MARALKVGARVQSKAIGIAPRFVGVVIATFGTGRKRYYHVKAKSGAIWHRDPPDIKPVTRKGKRK
jgi:hypothetical protein